MEAFYDATSKPYGYPLIDCHQLTPEVVRLSTSILPGERQYGYEETHLKSWFIMKMSKRMKRSLP